MIWIQILSCILPPLILYVLLERRHGKFYEKVIKMTEKFPQIIYSLRPPSDKDNLFFIGQVWINTSQKDENSANLWMLIEVKNKKAIWKTIGKIHIN